MVGPHAKFVQDRQGDGLPGTPSQRLIKSTTRGVDDVLLLRSRGAVCEDIAEHITDDVLAFVENMGHADINQAKRLAGQARRLRFPLPRARRAG